MVEGSTSSEKRFISGQLQSRYRRNGYLSLVNVVGLAYLYLTSTGTPKLRFLRSQHAFEQASDQPCSRLAPSSYSALSLLLRDLKVESGNESMDGESHPLILDLSLSNSFRGV